MMNEHLKEAVDVGGCELVSVLLCYRRLGIIC